MTIRVPLVEPGTRPELAEIEASIFAQRGRISDLYRVLLNSGPLAAGWEAMLTAVRNKSSVPADLRELMILRVAVVNRAPYEFDAHVPHAQKAGVSDAKIAAVRETVIGSVITESEAMVLELADAMTRNIDVPEALMDRLKAKLDARGGGQSRTVRVRRPRAACAKGGGVRRQDRGGA